VIESIPTQHTCAKTGAQRSTAVQEECECKPRLYRWDRGGQKSGRGRHVTAGRAGRRRAGRQDSRDGGGNNTRPARQASVEQSISGHSAENQADGNPVGAQHTAFYRRCARGSQIPRCRTCTPYQGCTCTGSAR
jgi:hypothetical protein